MKSNSESLLIQCRGFDSSPALEQRISIEHQKLVKMAPQLMRSRVTISKEHRHHHQGFPFEVHIELIMPGSKEIMATKRSHEDIYVAIKEAYIAMHQQLERAIGRQQDRSKMRSLKRETA